MRPLHSQNGDYNLTSQQTVLTHTPDASHWTRCQGLILLGDGDKPLDGTGGDFEVTVTITLDPEEGGLEYTIQPDPQVIEYSTAVTSGIFTVDFPVPAGAAVTFKLKSPNVADTDVDVTVYLIDTAPLQPTTKGRTGDVSETGEMGLDFNNIKDAAEAHTLTNITVPTVTTNTDMRGTENAALAETTATSTDVAQMQSHGDDNWATATNVTVSDKTGFKLASDGLGEVSTWTVDISGTVSGNSTHDAAAVVTAFGTGATLIACATATGFAVAGDAMTLTAGERNSIADAVLTRNVDNVEAAAEEHTLCTIVLATLEGSLLENVWTIKRTDGETTHVTKTATTDADAEPITGVS